MGKRADDLQRQLDEAKREIERLNRKIIECPKPLIEPWTWPYYPLITPQWIRYNDRDTWTIPVSPIIWSVSY